MFPLQVHVAYFLMWGIREVTHLLLRGQMTLAVLTMRHCGDMPNAINDESLQISRIMDVTTRLVATLVVHICGSTIIHRITGG